MEGKAKEEAWKPRKSKKETTPKKLAGPLGQITGISPNTKRTIILNSILKSHAWIEMMNRENLLKGGSKLKCCIRSLNLKNPRAPRIILLVGEKRENENLEQCEFTLCDPTGEMIGTFNNEVKEKLNIKPGCVICLTDAAWFGDKLVIMEAKTVEYVIDCDVRVEESLFRSIPEDLTSIYVNIEPPSEPPPSPISNDSYARPLKVNSPARRPLPSTVSSPKKPMLNKVSGGETGFSFTSSESALPKEKVQKVLDTQRQVAAAPKPVLFGTKLNPPTNTSGFEFSAPSNQLPKSPVKPTNTKSKASEALDTLAKENQTSKKIPVEDSEEQVPTGSLDFADESSSKQVNESVLEKQDKDKSDSSDGDRILLTETHNRKRRIVTDEFSQRKHAYSSEESESSHGEDVTNDSDEMYHDETDSKYEVEKVLAKQVRRDNKVYYLLRFVGFENPEWHPAETCSCDRLIAEFENREYYTQDTDSLQSEPEPKDCNWVGKRVSYSWHKEGGERTTYSVDVLKYSSEHGYRVRYYDDSEEWLRLEDIQAFTVFNEEEEVNFNLSIAFQSHMDLLCHELVSSEYRSQAAPIAPKADAPRIEDPLHSWADSDDQSESKHSQSSGEEVKVYKRAAPTLNVDEVDAFQPTFGEESSDTENEDETSSSDEIASASSAEEDEGFEREIDDALRTMTQKVKVATQSHSQLSQALPGKALDTTEEGIVVISIYDGIGAAAVALKNLGIKVKVYISFEINQNAIRVVKKRIEEEWGWNVVYKGDVTKVTEEDLNALMEQYGQVDLVIGGSPCNDLSILSTNRKGLKGEKSKVFFSFPQILNHVMNKNKNLYFLFENVASMELKDKGIITDLLGLEPARIDAKLITGAKRDRLYWTNIPRFRAILPKESKLELVLSPDFEAAASQTVNCVTTSNIKRSFTRYQNLDKKDLRAVLKKLKRYNAIVTKNKTLRGIKHSEVERLLGFETGYTLLPDLSFAARSKLLGCSFSVPIIEYFLSPLTDKAAPPPKKVKRRKQKFMDDYTVQKNKAK